ncbi:hypothetical protein NPIL_242461 [Nephila pilipes]|uniref:Uncharacterized protein n=1 Tax=Nephila pilipes TaxID=299642 RepID=A0A8X6QDC7_NEPPI|nr:hypothetical protein NPIL_242461 [Nephila pilipes]
MIRARLASSWNIKNDALREVQVSLRLSKRSQDTKSRFSFPVSDGFSEEMKYINYTYSVSRSISSHLFTTSHLQSRGGGFTNHNSCRENPRRSWCIPKYSEF